MSETAPVSVTAPSGSTLTVGGVQANSAWMLEAELEKLFGPGWSVEPQQPKRTPDAPGVFLRLYEGIRSVAV